MNSSFQLEGQTALHIAAGQGDIAIVEYLDEANASAMIKDRVSTFLLFTSLPIFISQ